MAAIPGEQRRQRFFGVFHTLNGQADGSIDFVAASNAFKRFFFLNAGKLFKVFQKFRVIGQIPTEDLSQPFVL